MTASTIPNLEKKLYLDHSIISEFAARKNLSDLLIFSDNISFENNQDIIYNYTNSGNQILCYSYVKNKYANSNIDFPIEIINGGLKDSENQVEDNLIFPLSPPLALVRLDI